MKIAKYNTSYRRIVDLPGEEPVRCDWERDEICNIPVHGDPTAGEVQRGIAGQLVAAILGGNWYVNHSHVLKTPGGGEVQVIQAYNAYLPDEYHVLISTRVS